MAKKDAAWMLAMALLLGAFAAIPAVESIGVCYGVIGNNLPSASDVVQLCKSKGITNMRIYFPDSAALQALSGTGIALVMDVGNENVSVLAAGASAATAWVKSNVLAYPGVSFRYIAVGNEITDAETQSKILPAMQNLVRALSAAGKPNIGVSTAVRFDAIDDSYPPSNGVFKDAYMTPIVQHLATTGAPLLANVYPYFAYRDDPKNIKLTYATFQPDETVQDPNNGLIYRCLLDAMVDAIYAALEDAGTPDVGVVVSESGWPSAGGFGASGDNARAYNQNLIRHVGQGTPKRPGALETYVFAMFNENRKTGDEIERHFGLFNPDKSPAYSISF